MSEEIKQKEKKKYVDYVSLICYYGLQRDFSYYCRKHRGLSLRRNARNFLLKNGFYNDLKVFRKEGFEVDLHQLQLDNIIKIAHVPSPYPKRKML